VAKKEKEEEVCEHKECYPYAFFDEFNTIEPMLIVQCAECNAHFAYPGNRIMSDEA